MKCPHCDNVIELTWKRYWRAPFGRHSCSSCGNRFRMKRSFRYYGTLIGLVCIFGLIPAGFALWLGATGWQAFITYCICSLLVGIPMDKKIDDTWRGTVPLAAKKRKNV